MSRFGVSGAGNDGSRFDRMAGYGNMTNMATDQRDPYERRIDERYEDRRYDEYYYGRDDGRREREDRDRRWSPDRGSGRDRGYDRGYDNYRDNRNDGRRGLQNKMKGGNRGVRNRPSDAPHRAGILGAAPGEHPPAMPAELPGGMGGGPGGGPQQQVLAAIQAQQTQTLLAALQATQAQLNQQQGLLPTPNMPAREQMNRNRRFQGNQQNRKRGYNQGFGGPYNKRSRGPRHYDDRDDRRGKEEKSPFPPPPTLPEPSATPEVCKEMIDRVEELRKRKKIDRNIADEDVQKLLVFCYDGKKYKCELCKIICYREESFLQHLRGKKHNLVVIEARKAGKDVHRDITDIDLHSDNWLAESATAKKILLKQSAEILKAVEAQKKIEQENYNKNPSNFVSYSIDTRKTAYKDNNVITFTSVSETKVAIKEFSSENHMFGCEFIKAVFGFSCRLCDVFLRNGRDVLAHIKGPKHQMNYEEFLEKNENYIENQVQRNKELESVLDEHLRKDVVLYESVDEENSSRMRGKRYIYHRDSAVVRVNQIIPDWIGKGQDPAEIQDGEEKEVDKEEAGDQEGAEEEEEEGEKDEGEAQEEEMEQEDEGVQEEQVDEQEYVDEDPGVENAVEEEEDLGSEGYEDGDAMEDDTDFDEKAFLEAAYGNDEEEEGVEEEEYVVEEPEEQENGDDEYRPDEPTEDPLPEVKPIKQEVQPVPVPEVQPEPIKKEPVYIPEKVTPKRRGRGGAARGTARGAPRGNPRGRKGRQVAPKYSMDHYEVIDEVGDGDE